MNIYVDFDGTLFNSDLLLSDYIDLLKKYNISSDTVWDVINTIFKEEKFNLFRLTNYINKHYDITGNLSYDLNELFKKNYVYDDVFDSLDILSKSFNLILLTYGDYEYQSYKIKVSNLSKYFTNVIITKDRKSSLDINYEKSIFIDNNPNEILGYYNSNCTKLIRLRRNDDKYSKINDYVDCVVEFKKFDTALINKCIEMSGINE